MSIISVFGAPNSGKTTIACKLAAMYAKEKKNVILLSCDPIVSGISQILNEKEQTEENRMSRSLGKLLSDVAIGTDHILRECIETKSNHLAVLGYSYGETSASYPQYFQSTAAELISKLNFLADIIIIDCAADIISDLLSTVALQMSDKIIRICTAEPKSMIYYDAVLPLLSDSKFKLKEHIKVLNRVKDFQEIDLSIEKYKGVSIQIPYDLELEKQFLEAELFEERREIKEPIQQLINYINGKEEERVKKKKEKHKLQYRFINRAVIKAERG